MKFPKKYIFEALVILCYLCQVVFLYFRDIVSKEVVIFLCLISGILLSSAFDTNSKVGVLKKTGISLLFFIIITIPLFIVREHSYYRFLSLYFACHLTSILIYLWLSLLSIKRYKRTVNIKGLNSLAFVPDKEATYLDVFYSIISLIIFITFGILMDGALMG